MMRIAWSQLRFRTARAMGLLAAMALAATAFTVLTAASTTSQLRVTGTVSANFSPAYDVLVRPRGARTSFENVTGMVQPNFLAGIYGGISMAQYRQIQRIPGVQVAAPMAMAGYALVRIFIPVKLPAADYGRAGRQLYRYSTTWVSGGGATRISQLPSFLYLTPNPIHVDPATDATTEVLPGGSAVPVCKQPDNGQSDPFGVAAQSGSYCWSKVDGMPGNFIDQQPKHGAFSVVSWSFPMLIAAIDPKAEAELDGLNHAVISGSYLPENAGAGASGGARTFPALLTSSSGITESAVTSIQRLVAPSSPPSLDVAMMSKYAVAPGQAVATSEISAAQAYDQLLSAIRGSGFPIDNFWTVGPVSYAQRQPLTPAEVINPPSVWEPQITAAAVLAPPVDEQDAQYRVVTSHVGTSGDHATVQVAGVFDPAKIRSFSSLSQVPLGPYQPIVAAPADAASRRALGGSDLGPSLNLGGYLTQPAQLITSLSALPALENSYSYSGNLHAGDPISVIRVRVSGITGADPVSRERINVVAQQIAGRTGLDVDIVAGASPTPVPVTLPANRFGQPKLGLTLGWVKKGVAVSILTAVDRKSLVLFTLILVVCALFVANAATAAVRGRRRELGVLACLGWTRGRLFCSVLAELAVLGLAAGLVGAVVALPVSRLLGEHASAGRALLAIPVAIAVSLVAGTGPALVAAWSPPLASVRPPALAVRRAHRPGGIIAMASVNVMRVPGRTFIGLASLAVGIAALTVLAAVSFAFQGVVVGSLLGDAAAVQARGVDYVAIGVTVALGVLTVADVMFLNIRERAAELATFRSFGWRETTLIRLVTVEGIMIGLVGSLTGAALGLLAASWFAGQLPGRLIALGALLAAGGMLLTAAVAPLPAGMLRRLPAALLAEE